MHSNTQLRLEMADRAVGFVRAHPAVDPQSAQVEARLIGLVERAHELAQQERAGQVTGAAAVAHKVELRQELETDYSSLVGIAKVAAKENPSIAVHRGIPTHGANELTFLSVVRVGIAEAFAARELLAQYGLSDQLLLSLTAGLDAYDAALTRQANALATRVGAGAALHAIGLQIMDVVRNLDALYRVRFKKDRELMAAWKSARNVAWPRTTGSLDDLADGPTVRRTVGPSAIASASREAVRPSSFPPCTTESPSSWPPPGASMPSAPPWPMAPTPSISAPNASMPGTTEPN